MVNEGAPSSADRAVLTLNAGSSSLKFAVFATGHPPRRLLSGAASRLGLPGATLTFSAGLAPAVTRALDAPDHERALTAVLDCLEPAHGLSSLAAAGHRLVHGGPRHDRTCL